MASLRLYKDFYLINSNVNLSADTYTLIDPVTISGEVVISGTTTIVEIPTIVKESLGVYYMDLNPYLYSIDNIYQGNFIVEYILNSLQKKIPTTFRLHPIVVGHEIELRLEQNNIRLDQNNQNNIRLELN